MYWGFSEAVDVFEEYTKHINSEVSELNILLFGSCDPRHILKSIAKSYKHSTKINFYVLDGCFEIIARNILLINLALEPSNISVKSKTHLFMDIYGNSLLRPSSFNYITSKSDVLMKILTDSDYLQEISPIFNFDDLKYKERDALEQTFHFWLPRQGHLFDIKKYWENSVRRLLGVRYDYRDGAFDWDLQMKLKDRGGKQICCQEYKHWRDTGVAFIFPEFEQSMANKTLVAGLIRNGTTYYHRGYVGDIAVGPYAAFGLTTSNKSLVKSFYGTNDYRATDVTEYNLLQLFYEINNKCEYPLTDEESKHKFGATILKVSEHLSCDGNEEVELKKYDKPLISTPNVRIYFLTMDDAFKIDENSKYAKHFDVVFVANSYFTFLKPEFINVLKKDSLLMFETKLLSTLTNENIADDLKKIQDYAKNINAQQITKFNINIKHAVVRYKYSTD